MWFSCHEPHSISFSCHEPHFIFFSCHEPHSIWFNSHKPHSIWFTCHKPPYIWFTCTVNNTNHSVLQTELLRSGETAKYDTSEQEVPEDSCERTAGCGSRMLLGTGWNWCTEIKLGVRKAGMAVGKQAEKFRMTGLQSFCHRHNNGHHASTVISPQITTICTSTSGNRIFYGNFISVGSNGIGSRRGSSDTTARH